MQEAGDGQYWNLINLATGLALTWDGSGQNVSDWGITSSTNPNQLWRFERRKNRHMIINKATNQGLQQAHNGLNPSKRNVHIWPEQSFAGNGWAWSLEDGGAADLMKLHFEKIRCIKPSTGQDGATKILFFGIDAALQAGLAAATGGASAAGSAALAGKAVTKAAVIKAMKKEARKELRGTLKGEVEDRAKQAAWDQVNSNLPSEVNDLNERANREINRHTPNAVSTALETAETLESLTSIEGLFNNLYGESPDDVMIHVNGVGIWPAGGRNHVGMKSQQEFKMDLDYIFDRSKGLFVQLVEQDSGSNDDWLGSFGLNIQQLSKKERFVDVLIQSEDEGSIYEVTFTIGPYLTRQEEQLQVWQEMQKAKARQRNADIIPKSAKMTLDIYTQVELDNAIGGPRIPLNRNAPNPDGLPVSPTIYLRVGFMGGGVSGSSYQREAPENVYFDETSGDPNDIIKIVYEPIYSSDPTKNLVVAKQITATGNGVGTAYINVYFRDAPGVTASVAVEVVNTEQQAPTNSVVGGSAQNLQSQTLDFNGNWSSQYTCPNGQTLPLNLKVEHRGGVITALTTVNDGCLSANIMVWSGMLNKNLGNFSCGSLYDTGTGRYAIQYVPGSIEVINKDTLVACTLTFNRVGSINVGPAYQSASNIQTSTYIQSASNNQLAPTDPTPYNPQQAPVISKQVPSSIEMMASSGASVEVTQFTLLNDSNFEWYINWIDGQGDIQFNNKGAIQPGQSMRVENGAKTWESHWFAITYLDYFLCSVSLRQGAVVKYSELSACEQSFEKIMSDLEQPQATLSVGQFYTNWVSNLKAKTPLPSTVDIFEIRTVNSACSSGCEREMGEAMLLIGLWLPNYTKEQLQNSEGVIHRLKELFLPDFCSSDEQKQGGRITFILGDRNETLLATPSFTAADCSVGQ